jgi:transketolase
MNGAIYAFLGRICEFFDQEKDVFIVCADHGAPIFDKYKERFPKNFVNVGIAEQNLIQISCGISLGGGCVISYGQSPFTCIRAYDQVRNAMAMMDLPIAYITTGVGFLWPECGATHYNIDDISIMRMIPNLKILNITDNMMASAVADFTLAKKGPLYIRFDQKSEGDLYQGENFDFDKGTGFKMFHSGTDVALVSYGYHFTRLLNLYNRFLDIGIKPRIIDLYSIPFDREALISELAKVTAVVTIEEHLINGGLGSIILELFSDFNITKNIKRIGLDFTEYPDVFGDREYFMNLYGLSDDQIVNSITKWVKII